MAKRRNSPEQDLHRSVAGLLWRVLPPEVFWTAINPISAKSKAAAGISKAMGLRAGVPDILIVHQGRAYFIELKAPNGRVSDEQMETDRALSGAGCPAVRVCKNIGHVLNALCDWRIPHLPIRLPADRAEGRGEAA